MVRCILHVDMGAFFAALEMLRRPELARQPLVERFGNAHGVSLARAAQGIDFDALPLWQRRGVGLYWERYEKPGFDPLRQVPVTAVRRRVRVDLELPAEEDYARFLEGIVTGVERGHGERGSHA